MFWLERRLLFFRLDRYDIPFPYAILTQGSSMQYIRSDRRPVDHQKDGESGAFITQGDLTPNFPTFFDLKLAIEMSDIRKWGPGGKIWV